MVMRVICRGKNWNGLEAKCGRLRGILLTWVEVGGGWVGSVSYMR